MIEKGNNKKNNQFSDMSEVRTEIDCIDSQVMLLLGKRYGFVDSTSLLKEPSEQIKGRPRFDAMLEERMALAKEQGLSSELVEKIHNELVDWFVSEEMKNWEKPIVNR